MSRQTKFLPMQRIKKLNGKLLSELEATERSFVALTQGRNGLAAGLRLQVVDGRVVLNAEAGKLPMAPSEVKSAAPATRSYTDWILYLRQNKAETIDLLANGH